MKNYTECKELHRDEHQGMGANQVIYNIQALSNICTIFMHNSCSQFGELNYFFLNSVLIPCTSTVL